MWASTDLTGSTSVTTTWAPRPLARMATPLPTHPYPATTTTLPATFMLVVRRMPSQADCPVPKRLSKRCLHRPSLTPMTGNDSLPAWASARSRVCLLYTSDAADDLLCVDLGGRRIIK